MRKPSDRATRNGGWLHVLRFDDLLHKSRHTLKPQPTPTQTTKADADHLHAIYSRLLSLLSLEPSHRADLRRRGLSNAEIERIGFASMPSRQDAVAVVEHLAPLDLEGAPGFFREAGRCQMVNYDNRYFVPYRDVRGRIVGMQLKEINKKYIWFSSLERPGGTGSGSPLHFARPELINDEILLTEGALKASVISYFTHSPVIAAAGVQIFPSDFAQTLKAEFPQLRRVTVTFDSDLFEKHQVFAALERLITQLERARFNVRVRTWADGFKGYDDYLAAQFEQEVA